jgi:protein-S-isoprenylcysteine O-methyltransferase Ste14
MNSHNHEGIGPEHPYSHMIQISSVIAFFLVWILDVFVIHFASEISNSIHLVIRVVLFLIFVTFSFFLFNSSHDKVFSHSNEPKGLISSGVYSYIRHPMYLSVLVLLLAFTILTFSLLSFIPWIIAVILFDRMVIFEEGELVKIMGNEYHEYMKQVPRWIPRLTSLWNK